MSGSRRSCDFTRTVATAGSGLAGDAGVGAAAVDGPYHRQLAAFNLQRDRVHGDGGAEAHGQTRRQVTPDGALADEQTAGFTSRAMAVNAAVQVSLRYSSSSAVGAITAASAPNAIACMRRFVRRAAERDSGNRAADIADQAPCGAEHLHAEAGELRAAELGEDEDAGFA